jgi:transposase
MDMTNQQWKRIEPIIKALTPDKDPRGRPTRDLREVFNGILWILRTGAPWKDMPQRYPPYQTCHRWFQRWVEQGVFKRIAQELVEDLYERGQIDIREAFIDGSFAPAKKGVLLSARQSAAKAPRSWPSQTLLVFLSPLTLKALRPMKSNWSKKP